jgi:hypothetical protein
MNHLVFLDGRAGELEKILSGVKTMLVKENDPSQPSTFSVKPGDSLYFLKDHNDCAVRVKAAVIRMVYISKHEEEDLPHALKEMQPRLHLTEEQYNHWTGKQQVLLVEFGSAHKIDPFQVASHMLRDRSDWISFEEFSLMMD